MSYRNRRSPVRNFVDLACGSFGALMLLAMALIKVNSANPENDQVSGRVLLRIQGGAFFNKLHIDCQIDGIKLSAADVQSRNSKGLEKEFYLNNELEAILVRVKGQENLELDLQASGLTSAHRVNLELVYNPETFDLEKFDKLKIKLWPSQIEGSIAGSVFSKQAVQELLDNPVISVHGENISKGHMTITIYLDPSKKIVKDLISVEVQP